MTFEDNLKEALAEYMRNSYYKLDVARVTGYEDDTESDGYCETCYYEYAVVRISYVDSAGKPQKWTYRGGFAELINSL